MTNQTAIASGTDIWAAVSDQVMASAYLIRREQAISNRFSDPAKTAFGATMISWGIYGLPQPKG